MSGSFTSFKGLFIALCCFLYPCINYAQVSPPPTVDEVSFACPLTDEAFFEVDIAPNEVVWYELTFDGAASSLSIDTEGSDIDTELGLYDSNGNLLTNNDDNGGGGTWSLIDLPTLAPGTYYIAIGEFNVNFGGGFGVVSTGTDSGGGIDLTIDLECVEGSAIITPPTVGTFSFTCPSTGSETQETTIDINEVVWYELNYDGVASSLSIDTDGSDIDTEIGLYSADGSLIDNNDDNGSGGTWSLIDLENFPPGTYYIAIGEFNVNFGNISFDVESTGTDTGGDIDITVSLTCSDQTNVAPPPIDVGAAFSCPVMETTEFPDVTIEPNQVIWFELSVDGVGNSFSIDTEGSSVDTEIGLYDSNGFLIENNDDNGGGGTWSLINTATLPAGVYYLAIGEFNVNFDDFSFGVESTGTDTGGSIFLSIALSCNEPPPCAISNTSLVGVVCNPADQDDAIVSVVFDVAQGSGDYNLVDADTDEVLGSITGAPTAGTAIGISGTVSGPTAAGQIVNVKVEDAQTGLPMELTNNGDFETGDLAGWQSFPTSASVFEITEDNPSSGAFAARLFNPVTTSGAVVKQANLGIGLVNAGDEVTVTFDARGQGDAGGVGIAELLSEIDGGGATSEVLGGAPFSIDPNFNFNNWTTFSFTTTAGADVTNGISLQFVAATGAAPGSVMNLFIDNVSVTVNGEACMGLPVEVTLPECISMECIISNISVLSTECITGSEDGYNVTVGFDVDNGSGSYALVDAANPDQVIGTVEGDMIATGLSISGPTNSSITELKVIDALIGGPEELTSNGGFEAGDVSEWQYFPTANSIFETITDNPSDGVFAGRLFNPDPFSAAVIKQANIGIGQVNPGDEITITFDARGQGDNGGVGIAELFSEVAGGGVSASELLGGAPFSLDSDFNFNEWTTFSYTVTAGPDVSGGVSLQFVAATGEPGSVMNLFIDNVSVTVESMCMGDPITPTPPECPGANVEFCVDVSCQDIGPGDEVRVFGSFEPFGSPGFFNPFLFPAFEEDADNPGVFCGTIFVTATPALEYKFIVTNGGQIVNEEQFAPDEPCTTTPFGFTNRVLEVVDDQDAAVRFGWLSCDENCLQLPDLPIDFQGEGIFQYSILDFGGTSTVLGTDPEVPGNTVACTEKTPGAETFAGTIVPFIGLENPIPLTGAFPLITVDVFAPAAGIPVLLKIEDSDSSNPPADPATVFAEVFDTTTTDGWQTLLFDFNQSTNMPFDEDIMYDRFVIFFDFGNAGDGSTYCFDNIQICDEDLEISCPEDVTVEAGESSTPDVTGMATADFVCAEPEITFSDASDQTAEGCSQFNFIITRTFTADSPDGMTSESCVQFITVEDTQAPDLVCNTILVRTDDQGNIELDDDDLAAVIDGTTDVDPDFTAEFTQTNFDCSDIDPDDLQITVGVEVEDCSGNQAECTVSLDVQPDFLDFDFSCILEVNATLNEDCQDILLPEQLLTGDFACLDLFNFDIVVMDEDPSNGPIIDGCGRFQYTIVEPDPGEAPAPPVNGFTGDLAEANWTVDDSGGGNAAFTTEELVLSTAADDGVTASYMFMEEGEFTFDFAVALETNIIDDEFFIIYDFDGNLIEAYSYQDGGITGNLFEDSGTLTVDVQPGFTIEFQLLGDGFQTGGVTSTATISNIVFQPAIAADAFNAEQFTNCWGFVNAEDKISPTLADSLVAPAPLFCTDIGDINVTTLPLEVSRCWIQSGDNGNTLMSSMNLQLRNRLLAGGGIPNFLDNCSDVEICVNDVVSDNGDCTNVVLTRTFTARDGLDCTVVVGHVRQRSAASVLAKSVFEYKFEILV
ncbi:MAG: DVUA0089 family protein, partial [Bacteroidota bacterium]